MATPLKNRRILISGASVAGPALAYWLRRYGFEPVVVERSRGAREGGYKIDVRGAAVDVIERMGLREVVRRASIVMRGASWVNAAGQTRAKLPADYFEARDDRSLELLRDDLQQALHDATRADVEYLYGDSIAAIGAGATGDEVTVHFQSAPPRAFDLVVGADGVHSNVRGLAFGDEARFVHDLGGYYVATFTAPNRLKLHLWDVFHLMPGRSMNLSSLHEDARARAVFVFASKKLPLARGDVAEKKRLVAEIFADAGWEVPSLLHDMAGARDFFLDHVNQIRMDHWHTGRAVLLGDAAYAPCLASGQGSSLALVGAYVLAGELRAAAGDHLVAFPRYEAKMRAYVEQNQKLGAQAIKAMVLRAAWQVLVMNLFLWTLPYMPWRGWISRRMKRVVEVAANAIQLDPYEEVKVAPARRSLDASHSATATE